MNLGANFKLNERLVFVRPDGVKYPLHAPPSRVVMSEEGFGTPPMEFVVDTAPFQHGDSVRAMYLLPRPIQLTVMQNFCSRSDYWNGRASFLDAIRPNRAWNSITGAFFQSVSSKLLYYLANGAKRQLDVVLDSGPGFAPPQGGWREWSFTEVIRFVAHDPVWYDPAVKGVIITGSGPQELEFPITFPIQFYDFSLIQTVQYDGTWEEYPSFFITGPITGLTITNETTGDHITLNYDVLAGDQVQIVLRGQKTVTLIDGLTFAQTNLLNYITSDSDLATFSLQPDPVASGGANLLSIRGTGTSGSTGGRIQYYNRYFGI